MSAQVIPFPQTQSERLAEILVGLSEAQREIFGPYIERGTIKFYPVEVKK